MRSLSQLKSTAQSPSEPPSAPRQSQPQQKVPNGTSPAAVVTPMNKYLGLIPIPNYAWYAKLKKSTLALPQWLYPIVWIILYILIGMAGYQYFGQFGIHDRGNAPLKFYSAMIVTNLIWYPIFFYFKLLTISWAILLISFASTLMTLMMFQMKNPQSATLLIPAAIYLAFSTYLNGYLILCNLSELEFENLRQMETMYQLQPNYPPQLRESWQDTSNPALQRYRVFDQGDDEQQGDMLYKNQ